MSFAVDRNRVPAYAEPRSPQSTLEESQAGEVMIRSDRAAIDRIPEGRSIARSMGFYSALLSMCVFTFLPAFHLIYHSHEVVDSGIALQCSGASSAHDEGQSCGSERTPDRESQLPLDEECPLCAAEGSFPTALINLQQVVTWSSAASFSISSDLGQVYSWFETDHPGRAPPSIKQS